MGREVALLMRTGRRSVQAWSVVLAYSMQLYFDFSGYSDMAIGLGIMFSLRFPLEFQFPVQVPASSSFGSAGT